MLTASGNEPGEFLYSLVAPSHVYNSDHSRVWADDSDIVKLTVESDGSWRHEIYFDGSDAGLTTGTEDIDAFTIRADGSLLISTAGRVKVPGIGESDGSDLLQFTPTSLGNRTLGNWQLYVDGSDVGISQTENIDGVAQHPDGSLVVSIRKHGRLPGIGNVRGEDLAKLTLTSIGNHTSGTWARYFDGSDVGLTAWGETIDGVSLADDGSTIHLSSLGTATVPGLRSFDEDIFTFEASSLSGQTTGNFRDKLTLNGSSTGISWANDIDAFHALVGDPANHQPPVIDDISDQAIDEHAQLSLTPTASDSDTPVTELTWTLGSGPASATVDPTTGRFEWTPAESDGPGSFDVTLAVTDGLFSDTASFVVTVGEVNVAPVLEPVGNKSVDVGGTLSFTVDATDADLPSNTLVYSISGDVPDGANFDSSTGLFTWNTNSAHSGTSYTITVEVRDGRLADSETFTIDVSDGNSGLQVDPIDDLVIDELVPFSYQVAASNSGGIQADNIDFETTPGGAALTAGTVLAGQFSSRGIHVSSHDPVNHPPMVFDSSNPTGHDYDLGTPNSQFGGPGIGNGGKSGRWKNDQSRGNILIISEDPADDIGADGPDDNARGGKLILTFDTPTAIEAIGLLDIDSGHNTIDLFNAAGVRISQTNVPRRGNNSYQEIALDAEGVSRLELNLAGSGAITEILFCEDGNCPTSGPLAYSLAPGSPAGMTISDTGLIEWLPSEAQGPENYDVTVVVSVGTTTVSETFQITVNEVNVAPSIESIPAQSVAELTLFSYRVIAADSDLPANNLTYSLATGAPSGMTISSTGLIEWTPAEDQGPDAYSVSVEVSDGVVTSTASFDIAVVEVNSAPVLAAIPDQTIDENANFSVQVEATDADFPANSLSYRITGSPPAGIDIDSNGLLTWTPTELQGPATYSITVEVSDGELTDSKTFQIAVNEVNRAPEIEPILDVGFNELSAFTLQVQASDADLPANTLAYSLTEPVPDGMEIDANGLISWTPSEEQGPAEYEISVQVSDGSLRAADTFRILVNESNQAPVLVAIDNQSVQVGELLSLTAIAIDEDLPLNTLEYSILGDLPPSASIDPSTGVFNWTPEIAGEYSVTVRVTDDGTPTLFDTASFTITVEPVSDDTIVLTESGGFVTERAFAIETGQEVGSRTLRLKLDTLFDVSDQSSAVGDVYAVYIVDSTNRSNTLLDRGESGTAVFTLTEAGAFETATGLVQYNGEYLTIDLSSLGTSTDATVLLQLLSQDADSGSRITVSDVTNTVNLEGVPSHLVPNFPIIAPTGAELDIDALTTSTGVDVQLENIRFDATTQIYTAELNLTATENVGSSVAIIFDDLPPSVQILNASGANSGGSPYLNLSPAAPSGGLRPNRPTDKVLLQFTVADNGPLALAPRIVVGLPNRAPTIAPITPVVTTPGDAFLIPIDVSDPDGDRVTLSIQATGGLPTATLRSDHSLFVSPRPGEEGAYQFKLIASDGALQTSQDIVLTVAEDSVKTTRVSGVVLNTDEEPLAGVPVELGRHQAVTGTDGFFTIELTSFETPTEVFDIVVPSGDPQFDPFMAGDQTITLFRSGYDVTTGTSTSNPRLHTNLVSSYIDASTVYGADVERATDLRLLDGSGKLRTSAGDLLPINNSATFTDGPLENENNSQFDPSSLFAAGDVRANENVALISLQTLLVREHNRKAEEIATANPTFTDEEIYQESRRWVTAVIQQITYNEFLPLLLGSAAIPAYSGYDANVDPSVSGLFSGAAFRFGHSISVSEFDRLDAAGQPVADGPISIREAFFNADAIKQDGVEPYLRGMATQVLEELDTTVVNDLRNFLFGPPGAGGLDLVSLNIQRGRDLGLPSYNQARRDFGLAPVTSFAQITSDPDVQNALASVYSTVEDIDVWVGGLAENHVSGAMVGELFQSIIADQFTRLRDADRFWFENSQFTTTELASLRSQTISDLIVRNTSIDTLPANGFTTSTAPTGFGEGGAAATANAGEYRSLDGSGNNLNNARLGQTGTNLLTNYTLDYGDSISSPAGADRVSAREISNAVFGGPSGQVNSLGPTNLFAIWGQLLTHDTNLTPGGTDNTLKVFGELEPSDNEYPFVAEKLPLVLDNPVTIGINNVIARPIYLPVLNSANAVTIDPNIDTTVTVPISEGDAPATVVVQAGTLQDRQGSLFTGDLSITEVPASLTPAALPGGLLPDTVVTIQPGNMIFTTPAPLTLPNRADLPAGTELDLWSINPNTGDFEIVGKGRVSADESVIETIEGGIRNSSWHLFVLDVVNIVQTTVNDFNQDDKCDPCEELLQGTSSVEAHSGAVIENHDLATYESLGATRGVQLVYNSLRADPRPIVHNTFSVGLDPSPFIGRIGSLRVVSNLSISGGGLTFDVGGSAAAEGSLDAGTHFWRTSLGSGQKIAIQADLSAQPTGVYDYTMNTGFIQTVGTELTRVTGVRASSTGSLIHVNSIDSPFGSGWELAGLQYLVEASNGAVLLVDGNGTEVLFELAADGQSYDPPPGHFSTLTRLGDGTFRHTTIDQTVSTFDEDNRLVSVVDRNGNATNYAYADGMLSTITDSVGLVTQFTYAGGRVSTIVDPANRTTSFEYDTAGNLTRVTDPDGTSRSWAYDESHHIVEETDKRGFVEQMEYDEFGRAKLATRKDGTQLQYQPAQVRGLSSPSLTTDPTSPSGSSRTIDATSTFVDGNGNVQQIKVNSAGQRVGSTDGVGQTETIVYNEEIQPVSITDARGFTTNFTYDANGNVTSIVDDVSRGGGSGGVDFGAPAILLDNGIDGGTLLEDFNGDGLPDLVTNATLYLNNASGGFLPGVFLEINSDSDSPQDIVAVDMNADGRLDIVGSSGWESSDSYPGLLVWLANEDGTFDEAVGYATQVLPGDIDQFDDESDDREAIPQAGLVVADFDNDSLPDVLLTQSQDEIGQPGTSLVLLLNNGDGTLANATGIFSSPGDFGSYAWEAEATDINNDGNMDLILSNAQGNFTNLEHTVTVLLGNGAGGFTAGGDYPLGYSDIGYYPDTEDEKLHLADLNNDGHLDAVVAGTNIGAISVVLGDGNGGFGDPLLVAENEQVSLFGLSWTSLTTADFNGDGVLDIAATSFSDKTIAVFVGNGDGTFQPAQKSTYDTEGEFFSSYAERDRRIFPIDMNGDGNIDLLTPGTYGQDVSILMGRGDGTFFDWDEVAAVEGEDPAFDAVEVIDLDADGILDIVVRTDRTGVEVRFGLGDREYSEPVFLMTTDDFTGGLIFPDLNNDGRPDIMFRKAFGEVSWVSFENNGDRTFGVRTDVDSIVPWGGYAETTDFNGDQISDIVIVRLLASGGVVSILLGDGTGGFTKSTIDLVDQPSSLVVADFNADGNSDLVVDTQIFIGDGAGGFVASPVTLAAEAQDVGDFNGDGYVDLAVVSYNFAGQGFDAGFMLNDGTGQFGDVNFIGVAKPTRRFVNGDIRSFGKSIRVADINSDGLPDIVAASDTHYHIAIGLGAGTFGPVQSYRGGGELPSIADMDRDGVADIVGVRRQRGSVPDLSTLTIHYGEQQAAGTAQVFTYDPVFNQLTSMTDELGRQTLFEVDPANGNTLSITRVIGQPDSTSAETDDLVTQYSYLPNGLVDQMIDPLGRITDYQYNAIGLTTAVTSALGTPDQATVTLDYDTAGNVIQTTDPNLNSSTYSYDALNRVTSATDPALATTTFDYDENGNVIESTDRAGSAMSYQYDGLSRLVSATDEQSNVTQFAYDFYGNLASVTDPLNQTSRYTYDARNRQTSMIDPDDGETRFLYDAADNLTMLIDPVGNRTLFNYDQRNRLISEVDPLNAVLQYEYDVVDNLVAKTDRIGRVTEFAYDDVDRLISETWTSVDNSIANTIDYSYDKASNLLSLVDGFSSLTWTYDARNRAISESNVGTPNAPEVQITYTYDAASNVTSVTDTINGTAGATTSYLYDALNRMERISQTGNGGLAVADKRVDLAYNEIGQFSSITRYSDLAGSQLVVDTSYQYDSLNRLERLAHDNSTSTVAFYDYVYDGDSRITSITDVDGITNYSYDDRDQLTGADHADAANPDETYEYNANGNRIQSHLHSSNYVTGLANRLLSDGSYNYEYDAEGNRIRQTEIASGKYRDFDYDHRNRLVAVIDYSSGGVVLQTVEFAYDAIGRRISKTVNGAITQFVYDGHNVLLDFVDADGVGGSEPILSQRYMHGPVIDQVLAQESAEGSVLWLLADHLGTTRDLVDETGQLVNHIKYDSYGKVIEQADPSNEPRYLFTGRELDTELKLYYLRTRYYDASLGQLISEDSLGFIDGVNMRTYARNRPVSLADPFGTLPSSLPRPDKKCSKCGEGTTFGDHSDPKAEAAPGLRYSDRPGSPCVPHYKKIKRELESKGDLSDQEAMELHRMKNSGRNNSSQSETQSTDLIRRKQIELNNANNRARANQLEKIEMQTRDQMNNDMNGSIGGD